MRKVDKKVPDSSRFEVVARVVARASRLASKGGEARAQPMNSLVLAR